MAAGSAGPFRERLAGLLEAHGAVAELARGTGISRRTIDNWLAGESSPTVETLERIAEALGTTPAALLTPDADPMEEELLRLFRQAPDDDARRGLIRVVEATLAALAPRVAKKKGEAG